MRNWWHEVASRVSGPGAAALLAVVGILITISLAISSIAAVFVGAVAVVLLVQILLHGTGARALYGRALRIDQVTYEWSLDDRAGTRATYRKRQHVVYLHSDVISIWDDAWGSGQFVSFTSSKGVPVDRFTHLGREHRLVSLRERRHRGDSDDFEFVWEQSGGFVGPDEQWVEAQAATGAKEMTMRVIFPLGETPKRVQRFTRGTDGAHDVPLVEADERKVAEWIVERPTRTKTYVITWEW